VQPFFDESLKHNGHYSAGMSVSFPRPPPEECEECDEECFLNTFCSECDQWMCAQCDSTIHKKGKRSRHTRRYRKKGESYSYGDAVRGGGTRSDERESTASGLPSDYNTLNPESDSSPNTFRGITPSTRPITSPFASFKKPTTLSPFRGSTSDAPPPPTGPPEDDEDEEEEEEEEQLEDTWVPPSAHLRANVQNNNPSSSTSSSSSLFDDSLPTSPTTPTSHSTSFSPPTPQKQTSSDSLDSTPSKPKVPLLPSSSQKDVRTTKPRGPPVVLLSGHLKKKRRKDFVHGKLVM